MLFKTFATAALAGSLVLTGAAQQADATKQAKTPPPPAPAPAQTSTDDSLKDRINFRLETSDTLRKYDVKVKVDRGVATLSGDVANAAQKAEAERLAKVTGVTRVQNDITIDPGEDKSVADRMKAGLTKTGEKITDGWITTKVKWFFMGEDALKGSDINVDTKDNVVTLKGTVKTAAGKTRAVQLAKNTDGVKQVVDQLTVK
jgi:hyperosmotically inducible periplasmic protein